MFRSRSLRILLLVFLVVGIGAILWSYLSRRGQGSLPLSGHLLSSEISRLSKEFEYSQLRGGKELFRVRAGTNTLLREAVQILEDVDMVRFDTEGTPTDAVESKHAVYRINEKQITFEDDVKIHLAGGSRIFADKAGADLESEQISIKGVFQFEQGNVQGAGRELLYSIPDKKMEISGLSRVDFSLGGEKGSAAADHVSFFSGDGRILLSGDASIQTARYKLSADKIQAYLNPNREVTSIKSIGNARLVTGMEREFLGSVIDIELDPLRGEPNRFEVIAGAPDSREEMQLAVFSESTAEGVHRLESKRITGEMGEQADRKAFLLSRLSATEDVVLRSSRLGIENSRARFFRANFSDTFGGIDGITLAGDVMLVRRPYTEQPSHQEVLRSQDLEILLDETQKLEEIRALDEVEIEISRKDVYRHLSARDSLVLSYVAGSLDEAVAHGDCVLRSIHEGERDMVRAPSLEAHFSKGQIERVSARGGVDLEFVDGETSVRQTRSEELELDYSGGRIKEATQRGEFRFWNRTATAWTELISDRAVYDPIGGIMTATGERDSILRSFDSTPSSISEAQSETHAAQFILNQKTNQIEAMDGVESVVRQNGEPLVLTSDRMQIDLESGWICYSESPRLIQGPNLITGREICLNSQNQRLDVKDDVRSLLIETEKVEGRTYEISAEKLSYEKDLLKVVYEDNVKVTSEDLTLTAPLVEIFFPSKELGELERIEASGGVVIVEKERTWKGRKAVYYRADDRVVVRND